MIRKSFILIVLLSILLGSFTIAAGQDETGLPTAINVNADSCVGGITDSTPRIAVVSAFGRELQLHIDSAEVEAVYEIGGRNFYVGRLENHDVVMFNSGGSLVNPAITMQDACYNFDISQGVLFSGIAGGMDETINIGDVVIPEQWRSYWHALLARENPDGAYQIPEWFPGDPEVHYDFVFPMPINITQVDGPADEQVSMDWFPASADFLAIAEEAVSDVELIGCTPGEDSVCLTNPPKVVVGGNGVSGDTYMDNTDLRLWVNETTGAMVLDMESSSVAQWANTRGVPVLIIRSASDLAGGGEAENEIGIFFALAADNGAMVLQAILRELPQR